MINKTKLHDDLTDAFIHYQYNLEKPFDGWTEPQEKKIAHYQTDGLFHAKVDNMVAGVIRVVLESIAD